MSFTPFLAQAAGGGEPSALMSLLPLVAIFVIFWFLLIRPQQKKMKEHKALVEAVKRGDKVVTAGGIIGSVSKVVSDTEVQLEIADGVRVRVVKATLQDILSKTGPAKAGGKGAPTAANDPAGGKPKGLLGGLGGLLGGGKPSK